MTMLTEDAMPTLATKSSFRVSSAEEMSTTPIPPPDSNPQRRVECRQTTSRSAMLIDMTVLMNNPVYHHHNRAPLSERRTTPLGFIFSLFRSLVSVIAAAVYRVAGCVRRVGRLVFASVSTSTRIGACRRRLPHSSPPSPSLSAASNADTAGFPPELMLWRQVFPAQHMPRLPAHWRLLPGVSQNYIVARPSNDTSLGLQGWRSGTLRRWSLSFPVLMVMDSPGQAAAGEGFMEWPLFDIFKIDLRSLDSWEDYLASMAKPDRKNIRHRIKLFGSFEADGRLVCEVVQLGPAAFGGAPEVQKAAVEEDTTTTGKVTKTTKNSMSSSSAIRMTDEAAVKHRVKQGDAMPALATAAVTVVVMQADVDEESGGEPTDGEAHPADQQGRDPACTVVHIPTVVATPPHVHESPTRKQQGNQQQRRWEQQPQRPQQSKTLQSQRQRQQPKPKQQQPETTPSTSTGMHRNAGGSGRPKEEEEAAASSVPALPPCVTPGSVGEAEALLSQLWDLYEQTGTRNGFVECRREYFASLVRRAPGIQAVVVREGNKVSGSHSGSVVAFLLMLPQSESLQLLYAGMQYDDPLVRQSNSYFQIIFVAIQLALAHNAAVRSATAQLAATTNSTPASCSPLGNRVGLINFVDLGPGRRFVKKHLGAIGHPVSMYTRGMGSIVHRISTCLLGRYFNPKEYVNDP